jgi:hypothetical protein
VERDDLLMSQAERDRLVTLKKTKKRVITQGTAADELGVSVRQVKRLLYAMKKRGDKAVVHGLKGLASNRRVDPQIEAEVVRILSLPVYQGFGPTLATEYLQKKHRIRLSKETVRKFMMRAGLWKAHRQKPEKAHVWRARRCRSGELVQWDSSEHDWLEGRGEKLYLIAMIDDATSRLFARFVRHDSTEENMRVLWLYLEKFGRPLAFYTDKASLFRTTEKRRRDEPGVDKDPVEMPLTQIGRALRELEIVWIAAHSPQAKGRVERNFGTAQDRLVKGMRVAGVKTLEQANRYLEEEYLLWWEREMTVLPANSDDAHRPLGKTHVLAASLSHVERRQVRNDYTFWWERELYRISPAAIVKGMRGGWLRVEKRLDGSMAVRYGERYLPVVRCARAQKPQIAVEPTSARRPAPKRRSDWNRNFDLRKAPKIWQAANASGHSRENAQ